ncbi:hypothetical protein HanRHA438_Chr14g0664511 [Helianthus annuus]|uniref:Uncharacterized protein n=1 Tax=Helianthus annuus TaxID=4232 RepID=A0A9K3EAD7_HELAN|nr:hypothetical protein HanXRQr2_Chr14g0653781 [Helianthus annuus]KAJ0464874.1 hypothetical protein HanHA300_Chr14g0532171 [Helianthus annuus]KAJ0486465.1 hypothetical protein HanHA89_Chr14g0579971 [Helianthus annuus]KAJ0657030.1 hypothetical protein HanLR1_Chr14g0542541 [Helianthus annuus]KAJ0660614.1 hypothetical protein HanOQP8_Chr14g0539731 [Helianthus annuus]
MIQLCFFYCQRVSWALSIVFDVYVYLVMWFICRVSVRLECCYNVFGLLSPCLLGYCLVCMDLFGCVLLSWFLNIRVGYHRCLFFDLLWTCWV